MNLKSRFYLSNAYYKALYDPKVPRELAYDQPESEYYIIARKRTERLVKILNNVPNFTQCTLFLFTQYFWVVFGT